MNRYKFAIFILLFSGITLLFFFLVRDKSIALLDPKGIIAMQERTLLYTAVLLSLFGLIPVFALTVFISWKYRASNTKAAYAPDWTTGTKLELTWWGILSLIILILAIITWNSTHALDPHKPIKADTRPMTIQVVALQWKWLFIYPEQNIATVNFIVFPEKTPITFELTADAPMNSFWIPQLGGQMYAMEGMVNKIHLMANAPGEFPGTAAEISGSGFAGMKFLAKATSQAGFTAWVQSVKTSPQALRPETYQELAKPSENNQRASYASVEKDLYNQIVMKFMAPQKASGHEPSTMEDTQH